MSIQHSNKAIEIKISTVVAIAVILHDNDLTRLESELQQLTGNSTDFFAGECAVVDVAHIDCATLDWTALIKLLRTYGIHPVAVRNAPELVEESISKLGLSIDLGTKTRQFSEVLPLDQQEVEAPVTEAMIADVLPAESQPDLLDIPTRLLPPMIIDTPVRGGQRIYARDTDLFITAVVNSGAEVIADGSIHIYAPLRGRALAGASGNTSARIFTLSMEAELVSIAGIYRTFENGFPVLPPHSPVQIKLNGDKIDVTSTTHSTTN